MWPIVIACASKDKSKSQISTFPLLCISTIGNFLTSHTCLRPYAKPPKRSGFNLKLFASLLLETFLLLTVATGFTSPAVFNKLGSIWETKLSKLCSKSIVQDMCQKISLSLQLNLFDNVICSYLNLNLLCLFLTTSFAQQNNISLNMVLVGLRINEL